MQSRGDTPSAPFDGSGRTVELTLYRGPQSTALEERLERCARRLAAADPRLGWRARAAHDEPIGTALLARPALVLGTGDVQPVRYLALPEGPEWEPFAWAVAELAAARAAARAPGAASLLVLVAAACPHCPHAVRAALEVGLGRDGHTVHVVDVQLFPELGARFGVRTVPTTILDDDLTVTEILPAAQLHELVAARGTAEQTERIFESLVASGRLEAASRQLGDSRGAELLCRAWSRSTTNSRIALLLAVEGAIERTPRCLDAAVPRLGALLASDDVTLVGDTADLLGRIGHPDARPWLQPLLEHSNADVVEAAADALEALGEAR